MSMHSALLSKVGSQCFSPEFLCGDFEGITGLKLNPEVAVGGSVLDNAVPKLELEVRVV